MKFTMLALLLAISAEACDICGCYMGLTPYQNFSSLGVFYRYRSFNGYSVNGQPHKAFPSTVFRATHGGLHSNSGYSEKNYELYRTAELRGKFFLHPRWETTFLVPYFMNSSKLDGQRTEYNGVGDATLLVGYHLIPLGDDPVFKHRLIIGTGTKLGIGKYQIADSMNVRLDPLLQPGTGSLDGLLYANYYLQQRNLGFSINALYKVNSTNLYEERFGNSITNHLNVFYRIEIGKLQLIPMVQSYFEFTRGLFKNKELLSGTNMQELMIGPGMDIYYKGLLISSGIQRSVISSVPPNELGSATRMILGLSYNFLQNKFLFNPKNKTI